MRVSDFSAHISLYLDGMPPFGQYNTVVVIVNEKMKCEV